MQETKEYVGSRAPVKRSSDFAPRIGCRIECWISTRAGALRLAGTLAEVLGWMRGHCPCGKIVELVEVRV